MFNAPFDTISNANKSIYIAKKKSVEIDDYNNEIVTYDKPFFYGMKNYQPLVGNSLEAYIAEYGETKSKIVRCFINYTEKGIIEEFDLAYLYGANPKGELVNGDNANYVVKTCKEQNTKIMVLFEEIIKEENYGNYEDNV